MPQKCLNYNTVRTRQYLIRNEQGTYVQKYLVSYFVPVSESLANGIADGQTLSYDKEPL
jgi:hypothetical protein